MLNVEKGPNATPASTRDGDLFYLRLVQTYALHLDAAPDEEEESTSVVVVHEGRRLREAGNLDLEV